MGLDMYIDKCRKPKIVDGKREYEEREEVCYWRKNWDLMYAIGYGDEEYNEDMRLFKDDVEKILQHVTHNRDYWGGFSSVEQVCRLLDEYDYLTQEEKWVIVFHADW